MRTEFDRTSADTDNECSRIRHILAIAKLAEQKGGNVVLATSGVARDLVLFYEDNDLTDRILSEACLDLENNYGKYVPNADADTINFCSCLECASERWRIADKMFDPNAPDERAIALLEAHIKAHKDDTRYSVWCDANPQIAVVYGSPNVWDLTLREFKDYLGVK